MSDPHAPTPTSPAAAIRVREGRAQAIDETVALESPLEIRVNGRSHTILMVNPTHLEALALGFALSEGLAPGPEDILGLGLGQVEMPVLGPAWWAEVTLSPELARRAKVKRVAPAATSCGLCGLESLKEIKTEVAPLGVEGPFMEVQALFDLFAAMEAAQPIFKATGATHAAALGDAQGRLVSVAEDVGRHNALDKAIGLAVAAGHDPRSCAAVLSGRLSYEMALKSARAGLPVLGSVSAPTSLSLALMDRLGLTLVAFGRHPRLTVFTHPARLTLAGRPLDA